MTIKTPKSMIPITSLLPTGAYMSHGAMNLWRVIAALEKAINVLKPVTLMTADTPTHLGAADQNHRRTLSPIFERWNAVLEDELGKLITYVTSGVSITDDPGEVPYDARPVDLVDMLLSDHVLPPPDRYLSKHDGTLTRPAYNSPAEIAQRFTYVNYAKSMSDYTPSSRAIPYAYFWDYYEAVNDMFQVLQQTGLVASSQPSLRDLCRNTAARLRSFVGQLYAERHLVHQDPDVEAALLARVEYARGVFRERFSKYLVSNTAWFTPLAGTEFSWADFCYEMNVVPAEKVWDTNAQARKDVWDTANARREERNKLGRSFRRESVLFGVEPPTLAELKKQLKQLDDPAGSAGMAIHRGQHKLHLCENAINILNRYYPLEHKLRDQFQAHIPLLKQALLDAQAALAQQLAGTARTVAQVASPTSDDLPPDFSADQLKKMIKDTLAKPGSTAWFAWKLAQAQELFPDAHDLHELIQDKIKACAPVTQPVKKSGKKSGKKSAKK